LNPTDAQLEYPTIYASARDGWALKKMGDKKDGVKSLLDTIIERFPPPNVRAEEGDKVKMLIS